MKPKLITFSKKKSNHFYAIKNEKEQFELITNPKKGDKVYEYAVISGGSGKEEKNNPLLLEIPIPSCEKHQHQGKNFVVKTCKGWSYIAIPTKLGSLRCRECHDELFLPEPYLRYADLSDANLRYADLSGADLSGADLSGADLSGADLRYAMYSNYTLETINNLWKSQLEKQGRKI